DLSVFAHVSRSCKLALYGRISRRAVAHLALDEDDVAGVRIPVVRFRLSSHAYDTRYEGGTIDLDAAPIPDMRGVLFSALLVCEWARSRSVAIAGVDFSGRNFNGSNPNRYPTSSFVNLAIMA